MKAVRWFALFILAWLCTGCAHTTRLSGLYVPARCIEKVSWTRPCATVSQHLVKCDGVMVQASCVSPRSQPTARVERNRLPEQ